MSSSYSYAKCDRGDSGKSIDLGDRNHPDKISPAICKNTDNIAAIPSGIIKPVPMPRSISFRRVAVKAKESNSPPESVFSPETPEQRSKKRRSQSMDDIFGPKLTSLELDMDMDVAGGFRVSTAEFIFNFQDLYFLS